MFTGKALLGAKTNLDYTPEQLAESPAMKQMMASFSGTSAVGTLTKKRLSMSKSPRNGAMFVVYWLQEHLCVMPRFHNKLKFVLFTQLYPFQLRIPQSLNARKIPSCHPKDPYHT